MHATTWMNLENIMLSERSQTQRPCILWFHLHEMSRIGKSIETESRLVNCQKLGGKGDGTLLLMGLGFLIGIIKMFWNYIVVVVSQPCKYNKNLWIVHFKWVNAILWKLYLNFKNLAKSWASVNGSYSYQRNKNFFKYILKRRETETEHLEERESLKC